MAKTERYVQMKRLESLVGSGSLSSIGVGGGGLLTTIDDLPYTYKIQYVRPESPLDLSKKPPSINGDPITPPQSPPQPHPKKRIRIEMLNDENDDATTELPIAKLPKIKKENTPKKPINVIALPKTAKSLPSPAKEKIEPSKKQHKAVRKLKFDEKKSSPVSGTIIRALDEIDENVQHESGDIDPQYNIVEVTEEAKAEIAAIENVIGAYTCKLCQIEFEDAFCLARHRCSCIVLLEYRCPECGKRFNCPANLASHRRWHKPKEEVMKKTSVADANGDSSLPFPCNICGKHFKRQAYLRKHLATHNKTKGDGATTLLTTDASDAIADATTASSKHSGSTRTHSVCSGSDDSASVSSASSTTSQDDIRSTHSGIKFTIGDYAMPSLKEAEENDAYVPTHLQRGNGAAFHFFKREIFTEDENIAVAALAHLRHSQDSVIRHTTALSI